MNRLTVIFALAIAFPSFSTPAFAVPFTFDVLPAGGGVSGPPGSTVGWGYEITNPSVTDWLELTTLDADPFLNGTPLVLFDFPIVPPGATVSLAFNGTDGLYQLTWDPSAPVGFVNSGEFVANGVFYDADPLGGPANVTGAADEQRSAYSATVTRVPEPATMLLMGAGLLASQRSRLREWVRRSAARLAHVPHTLGMIRASRMTISAQTDFIPAERQ